MHSAVLLGGQCYSMYSVLCAVLYRVKVSVLSIVQCTVFSSVKLFARLRDVLCSLLCAL